MLFQGGLGNFLMTEEHVKHSFSECGTQGNVMSPESRGRLRDGCINRCYEIANGAGAASLGTLSTSNVKVAVITSLTVTV